MPEFWDVYDKNGNKLNKIIQRGKERLADNEYHLGSAVFIKDNDDFLIQQRSFKKDIHPGKWSVTGGSALSGEDAIQCAIREVKEELGIDLKPNDLKKIYNYSERQCLFNIFVANVSKTTKTQIQTEEVEQIAWVPRQKVLDLYTQGKFMLPFVDKMLERIK